MATEVFIDTSHAIAMVVPRDRHHAQAQKLSEKLQVAAVQLVTTQAALVEICDCLSKARYRDAAVELVESLVQDDRVRIIGISDALIAQAFQLFRSRSDKEWGLTDCVSFVVMERRGIIDALTADEHFRQAGFRALLLEP